MFTLASKVVRTDLFMPVWTDYSDFASLLSEYCTSRLMKTLVLALFEWTVIIRIDIAIILFKV